MALLRKNSLKIHKTHNLHKIHRIDISNIRFYFFPFLQIYFPKPASNFTNAILSRSMDRQSKSILPESVERKCSSNLIKSNGAMSEAIGDTCEKVFESLPRQKKASPGLSVLTGALCIMMHHIGPE